MKYLKTYEGMERLLDLFTETIYNFYGSNYGIYCDYFDNELTHNTIKEHLHNFYKKYTKENDFDGDSFDREIFRDYLFVKLGYVPLENIDYQKLIKKLLTKEELEESELLYKTRQYNL